MADFPLFINMEGRNVIVIGGGSVALRKIRILIEYGADIRMISSKITDELKLLADKKYIVWTNENLTEHNLDYLAEAFLVICASDAAYTGGLCQSGGGLGLCVSIGGQTGQCGHWYQYIRRCACTDQIFAGENRSIDTGMVR